MHKFDLQMCRWEAFITGGGEKAPLQDGVVSSATLYQPQTLTVAGQTLIIADSGNAAIRLVTSAVAMVPMLTAIRRYLASFGIPKQKEALSLVGCEVAAKALSNIFERMAEANGKRSSRGFTGEGPDGNVSAVNRKQLNG